MLGSVRGHGSEALQRSHAVVVEDLGRVCPRPGIHSVRGLSRRVRSVQHHPKPGRNDYWWSVASASFTSGTNLVQLQVRLGRAGGRAGLLESPASKT